jgi:SAM-dependent methyltransferase
VRYAEIWRPTRFVLRRRGFRPSSDVRYLALTSRFVASVAIRAYEPLLREHTRGHVLDLGCGLVPYFAIYRENAERITCVDWPTSFHDNPHVDVHADLNAGLPFRDELFDTVLLTDVLEHIARPGPLVREVGRVLAPGGRVVITVPFFHGLHEEPHDYYRYTSHALRRFCDEAGLHVLHLEPFGGSPEVIMDLVVKNLVFSRLLTRVMSRAFGWLSRRGFMQRLSRRSAGVYPLGYCLVAQRAPAAGSRVTVLPKKSRASAQPLPTSPLARTK